tara:strand:+ start:122 stop:910 length:789 start_codon:yes stop_codon:yes gene_type:complete
MILIISVSIILLLPVISYLAQPLSSQKSLVFLFTFLFFGGFVLNFLSSNPLIGSWVKATQSDAVLNTIINDGELDNFLINKYLENTSSEDESFLLGAQVFYKSLELKSFNSAESMLRVLNLKFSGENFQVPIFNLLADLRDTKYPNLGNSKVLVNIESPSGCELQLLKFFVSIPGGPEVDIASREIFAPDINEAFTLDKSHSLVRGFDITSAFLQQEIIKVEAQARCSNETFQSFKSIDLKYSIDNQEELFFYTNEWLKKEQ